MQIHIIIYDQTKVRISIESSQPSVSYKEVKNSPTTGHLIVNHQRVFLFFAGRLKSLTDF